MASPVRAQTATRRDADWDPLQELDLLNRELARYLESWRQLPRLLDGAFTPVADVEETDEAYHVEIDVPGVARHDIDVMVAGRRLVVRGARHEKERVGIVHRSERLAGRFHVDVALPGDIADGDITTALCAGVLTVRVPKPRGIDDVGAR